MGDSLEAACRRTMNAIGERKHPTTEERDSVLALHVLAVAGSIGGRVAEQLESLIDTLNEREHLRRERRTQAASATASMRMLTWLPIVCGSWLLLDNAEVRHFLIGSPSGWICLVLGVGSNIVGRLWLQREVAAC
jgi:Flp pilus assembly protein TadB